MQLSGHRQPAGVTLEWHCLVGAGAWQGLPSVEPGNVEHVLQGGMGQLLQTLLGLPALVVEYGAPFETTQVLAAGTQQADSQRDADEQRERDNRQYGSHGVTRAGACWRCRQRPH